MPYALRGNCVIRSDTGSTVKCHPTRAKAAAHLRALYANVKDVGVWVPVGLEFNPDQPRDEHGRWTSDGGKDAPDEGAVLDALDRWAGQTANPDDLRADERIQRAAERQDAGRETGRVTRDWQDAEVLTKALDAPDVERSTGELYRGMERSDLADLKVDDTVRWPLAPATSDRDEALGYFGGQALATIEPGSAYLPIYSTLGVRSDEVVVRGTYEVAAINEASTLGDPTLGQDSRLDVTLRPVGSVTASAGVWVPVGFYNEDQPRDYDRNLSGRMRKPRKSRKASAAVRRVWRPKGQSGGHA